MRAFGQVWELDGGTLREYAKNTGLFKGHCEEFKKGLPQVRCHRMLLNLDKLREAGIEKYSKDQWAIGWTDW